MSVHLGLDLLFPWPIPVLWPLSSNLVEYPISDWGDKVTLTILLAGMWGLALFRGRTRLPAALTCAALAAYLAFRAIHPA